jgi:DeoD family purine-nucleoside phosphorylase
VPRPIHIHPTTDLADRVLLPGDPGRALLLAQELLAEPKMFNHNRGLWGYTGAAADGEPLTIQSTGMGGPSAAIVLEELIELGVRRAVRVGTCGALDGDLRLGDLVVAAEALAADGTSRALGAGERIAAPGAIEVEGRAGLVASTDLFYDPDPAREAAWREAGALAVEMETAALYAVGARRGIEVAAVLAVTDLLAGPERARIDDEGLRIAGERVGRAGAAALRR